MSLLLYFKAALFLVTTGFAFSEWSKQYRSLRLVVGAVSVFSFILLIQNVIKIVNSDDNHDASRSIISEIDIRRPTHEEQCSREWQVLDQSQLEQLLVFARRCGETFYGEYAQVTIKRIQAVRERERKEAEALNLELIEKRKRQETEVNQPLKQQELALKQVLDKTKSQESPERSTSSQVPQISGRWRGTYRCQNGTTGAELIIEQRGNQVNGRFNYGWPRWETARFRFEGHFDSDFGVFRMKPTGWIHRPNKGFNVFPFHLGSPQNFNSIKGSWERNSFGCAQISLQRQ